MIRSPLLVKFGLNAWGEDFDHIHYGLGKAKYRSANVPVFTKQLDTVQYSLVAAIHNIFELGVEKAIAENRSQQYLTVDDGSAPPQPFEPISEEEAFSSMARMEALLDDVLEHVTSRREALKEEVLRLEQEAAEKNDHE